jgi:predicted AAA+ superfamily ATPase
LITKDILPSRRITNHALFRQATQLALSYPAKEISYTKLLGQLQERGNVSTIKDYLKILEDAFLIRLLYKYSTRPLTLRTSSPKIIVSVPALCSVLRYSLPMTTTERGSVFESVIISHIARSQWPISYWRNGHYEVDAVIKSEFGLLAIEVKSTERIGRLDGLSKFIKSFPGSKGVVIDEEIGLKILTMSTPKDSVRWLYDITTG